MHDVVRKLPDSPSNITVTKSPSVGLEDVTNDCWLVGNPDIESVGGKEGDADGNSDGDPVGLNDGWRIGAPVGLEESRKDGEVESLLVGVWEGAWE